MKKPRIGYLIVFLLIFFPSLSHAQIDLDRLHHKQELDALRGLKNIGVLVTVDSPLVSSEIESAIRARLKARGAPVMVDAPTAMLIVTVKVKSDSRVKGFAVALNVEASQFVEVERSQTLERAVLWQRSEIVITDSTWKDLRERIAALVDEFASDFLVSNPETYREK